MSAGFTSIASKLHLAHENLCTTCAKPYMESILHILMQACLTPEEVVLYGQENMYYTAIVIILAAK